MEDWQNGGFGLYLHWPFCESKAPNFDFKSLFPARMIQDACGGANLLKSNVRVREPAGRFWVRVFLGGGTPS